MSQDPVSMWGLTEGQKDSQMAHDAAKRLR